MNRSRITITIKSELLKSVDALIDGTKIKNRSHAIESILAKEFTASKMRQAVILAGGKGIELPGKEKTVSRVLTPFEGKLFVEHLFQWLRAQAIEEVIISASDFTASIREEIGDGAKFGLKVLYLPKDGGTASVLRHLVNLVDDTFLMMNGDVLSEMKLEEMFDFHKKNKALCTVGMISVQQPAAFGNIVLRGNQIMDFIEKPKAGEEESYLVNAGIYIMEPEILGAVSPRYISLEKDLFPALAKAGKLCGYYIQGKWLSLGSLKHE